MSKPKTKSGPRTYILDTNVILNDPGSLQAFAEHTIVITEYVLRELDEKKRGDQEINQNARAASRWLDEITAGLAEKVSETQDPGAPPAGVDTGEPIPIPGTPGFLVILMDDRENPVKGTCRDDQILALVHKHRAKFKTPIIVITKDTVMGLKALGLGFGRQNYRREQAKVEISALPVISADRLPLNDLFANNVCSVPGILQWTEIGVDGRETTVAPGYHLVDYAGDKGPNSRGLIHIDTAENVRLVKRTPTICRSSGGRGIQARNLEQQAAFDALLNEDKKLVCLLGKAGTGKTLLAIAASLHMLNRSKKKEIPAAATNEQDPTQDMPHFTRKQRKEMDNQRQRAMNGNGKGKDAELDIPMRVIITRPTVSMGKSLGFLPGSLEEKMDPWLQPIYDNLDVLLGCQMSEKMRTDGTIQLQALEHIRGRTINNAYLIVDESQNLNPLEVKTILTRAGQHCRIILTGDPAQIDNPFVDKLSNGLSYTADRLGKDEIVAVIPLVVGERSELSALAAEKL